MLAERSSACAACGCGDPTLSAVGAEKPFAGRLRVSLDARHRSDAVGVAGVDRLELRETRSDFQGAWSPTARWTFLATLPAGYRQIGYSNGSSQNTTFVGDPELRAKAFVWQNRAFDPTHLLAVLGGASLPFGRAVTESAGRVPLELGVSLGVPTASLGLSYAGFARPWSLYASATLSTPLATSSDGDRPSRSLRSTVALQHQTMEKLALRASAHTRADTVALDMHAEDNNSGGWIAFAGPEVLWNVAQDLTLFGYARLPIVQRLRGAHEEGAIWGAGAAWDL